jgi:membrane protein implicated in regulation of membrane protease activity
MVKNYSVLLGMLTLWIAAIACRPIIAIGWTELIIIFILIAVLLGPLLFRLYRFLDNVQKASQAEDKKKKQG